MKKRRFLRKALRLRMILLYLLVIAIGIVVLTYTCGGIKAQEIDVSADNTELVKAEFKDMSIEEFQDGDEYLDGEWVAQTDEMVMYLNKVTTIVTVYIIEEDAIDGTEQHNGKTYPHVDVTKCKKFYRTAQPGTTDKSCTFTAQYASSKTGKLINVTLNSMSNSTRYANKLTGDTESHYYLRYIEDGIQILYHIGEFSAGIDYLPEYYYATKYRPDLEAYYEQRTDTYNTEAYEAACDEWVQFMAKLGIEDAEKYLYDDDYLEKLDANSYKENGYKEILNALADTFDERFRGNVNILYSSSSINTSSLSSTNILELEADGYTIQDGYDKALSYSGTINVYTREAMLWLKDKLESEYGMTNPETGKEITIEDAKPETTTYNIYWQFKNLPNCFFTDHLDDWFNNEDTPLTTNPYLPGETFKFLKESVYTLSSSADKSDFTYYKRYAIKGDTLKTAYNLLYTTSQFTTAGRCYYFKDAEGYITPLLVGGYVARDSDNKIDLEDEKIQKAVYTLDVTADDNMLFNIESETSLAIFQVGIEFKLSKNGLDATIMANSLVDSTNASDDDLPIYKTEASETRIKDSNKLYYLYNLNFLPYFTYVDNTGIEESERETGQIIVPDGSGAVINFNNGKYEMNATAVNTTYYGVDSAYTSKTISEETLDLMLGMYGFIYTTNSNPRGVLAAIEKGGNQVSLYAYTSNSEKNAIAQANFSVLVRANEVVKVGAWTSKNSFTKWAESMTQTDFKFVYMFLDEDHADYVSLANRYREYLIDRDGLTDKDDTTDTVVDIDFLGSFEKYALFLGFKYLTPDSLTTFEQATEIVDELTTGINGNKVNELNITYSSWTNEEMEYHVGGNIKVSNKLGGIKGMRNFAKYCEEKGYSFYPELRITTTNKYDYSFGKLKYTARSVANNLAQAYQFDVATQRQDKKKAANLVISPRFYLSIVDDVTSKLEKLNIEKETQSQKQGYCLVDLGNFTSGSYKKGEEVYGQASIQYQLACLEELSQSYKLKIEKAYDYAFKYADFISNVPLTATARTIYDETIPFYQLVISGLIDYSTETINGTSSKSANWFFSKAVESGSNLSFEISAENPTVLLNTDYTYYYQSYYQNWKETITSFASRIDYLGINQGRLVFHENVAKNIAHVKYQLADNSIIELYVNNTGNDYKLNGTVTLGAYEVYKVE